MALFRFGQNWDPFGDLEREVDRLLRSVDLTFHGIRLGRQYPAVNLYEFDEEYVLTAELPGTKLEDLELTFAGGILTLKGRRDELGEVPENRYRRSERFHGEWQRALSLPERIQEESLTATFTDGVLRVRLPKGSPAPVRQIAVTEGIEIRARRAGSMSDELIHRPDHAANGVQPPATPAPRLVFTPPIDIYETEDGLVLMADLPGVSLDSLELQVQNNKLTLLGRVKPPVPSDGELRYQEYQIGDFLRSFILSDEVDHDRVTATLNNGVLKVWLPKAKKAQARRIQVVPE